MFEIRVTKLDNQESNVKGLVSMVVDGKFAFSSMRVIESEKAQRGFFVAMPSYRTKEGKYVDLYKPVTSNMSNALADAVAKAMESGEPVTIGNGETHISTYVTPVHYQNNETMAAKVNLKCGDMVCDSIVLRKSIEGNLFVAYPSYEKKQLDESGNPVHASYCNPTTAEFRTTLSDNILAQYDAAMKRSYEVKPKEKETQSYSVEVPTSPAPKQK